SPFPTRRSSDLQRRWDRFPIVDFTAVGRDKPGPTQVPRPRRNWRWCRTLWGRLYAGQRRWDRCPSGDFSAVGRDKPGPTGYEAVPELAVAQDAGPCGASFTPAPQLTQGYCGAVSEPEASAAFGLRVRALGLASVSGPASLSSAAFAAGLAAVRRAVRAACAGLAGAGFGSAAGSSLRTRRSSLSRSSWRFRASIRSSRARMSS